MRLFRFVLVCLEFPVGRTIVESLVFRCILVTVDSALSMLMLNEVETVNFYAGLFWRSCRQR